MRSNIFFAALLLLVCGCTKNDSDVIEQKSPGIYIGETAAMMSDLRKDDVFLKVNGKCFTKADFDLDAAVYDKMLRMGHKARLTGFNAQAADAIEKMSPLILNYMPRRELFNQYANQNSISVKPAFLEMAVGKVLRDLNRSHSSLDAVCAEMGPGVGERFRYFVNTDALEYSLREHFDKDGLLDIKEDDIISYSNRYERSVVAAAEKNARQLEMLNKALDELKRGADFKTVAAKYSEGEFASNDAEYWDEYYKEDFEDEEQLAAWALSAKEGDISGVLELDDGYGIIKLLKKREEGPDPSDETVKETVWEFAKLHRDLYEPLQELTHDEIKAAYVAERTREIQKKMADAILKEAVIEWPYGTNLFENAKN